MENKKKNRIIILICSGIFMCFCICVCVLYFVFMPSDKSSEVYEGNHMKFKYDRSLKVTSREQKNCANLTVSDAKGDIVVSSVIIQTEEADDELFFESVEKTLNGRKEMEIIASEKSKSNDKKGEKHYKEYDVLDIDNNKYRALAQVQSLENDYYIFTLAYIEEDFEENKRLARITMDSVEYSDVEAAGDLELTEYYSPLFEIYRFLLVNVDEDVSVYSEDLEQKTKEYEDSIPADLTLKPVEEYEYLMQIDIGSADKNVYPVMVPKDYDPEGEKRFITYYDNGFMLSMYARELFSEETLMDFFETCNDFIYEDPEKDFVNVEKTEIIEKDGLIYQICTADWVSGDGQYIIKEAEIAAAIPLGGTDILSFSLRFDINSYNSETIKYLEELERFYGVPVTQFADLAETEE